jgi:hypothetical protein
MSQFVCLKSVRCAIAAASVLVAGLSAAGSAPAQDYGAAINAQMNAMNNMINSGQQQINGWVAQKMRDPKVQAGYRTYVANARAQGMPVQDFPTWTYNYIYTNGYSAEGKRAAMRNNAINTAKVGQAAADLRAAERARGDAQANMSQHFSNNQNEFGNQLQGNSTYYAPNGQPMVLPHTWQKNGTYNYNGGTYHVDQSGQYHILAADGYWYPLAR